jgi:hypothetical protein
MDVFMRVFMFLAVWTWTLLVPLSALGEEKFNIVQNWKVDLPHFFVDGKGTPWLAHRGMDRALYVKAGKRERQGKVQIEGVTGIKGRLVLAGDEVLAIWRGKVDASGRKYCFVNRADRSDLDFGNATTINTATDVLPPVHVAQDGNRIFVTWVDERAKDTTIYMNYSLDGGKAFQEKDICLTPGFAADRSSLIIDEGYFFCFLGMASETGGTGIFYRHSTDGGNWSDIEKVTSVKGWAPFKVEAVAAEGGPLLFWGGVEGIFCARRDSEGRWQTKIIESTEGMDVNRFQVARDSKGNLFLAASYRKWGEKIRKPNAYVFKSADGGVTWDQPVKVNHNPFDNTSAKFPALFITEKDAVVVVWQDHRLIRGNIHMNYSLDGGKTWLPEDINLDDKPGKYNDYYPFISGHGNRVFVLWYRFPEDTLYGLTDFYLKEVSIK